jgi:hypothetical protein
LPVAVGNIQKGQELSCIISNEFVVDSVTVGRSPQAFEYSPANDNIYSILKMILMWIINKRN